MIDMQMSMNTAVLTLINSLQGTSLVSSANHSNPIVHDFSAISRTALKACWHLTDPAGSFAHAGFQYLTILMWPMAYLTAKTYISICSYIVPVSRVLDYLDHTCRLWTQLCKRKRTRLFHQKYYQKYHQTSQHLKIVSAGGIVSSLPAWNVVDEK